MRELAKWIPAIERPGRADCKCKGPGVGAVLACLRRQPVRRGMREGEMVPVEVRVGKQRQVR